MTSRGATHRYRHRYENENLFGQMLQSTNIFCTDLLISRVKIKHFMVRVCLCVFVCMFVCAIVPVGVQNSQVFLLPSWFPCTRPTTVT